MAYTVTGLSSYVEVNKDTLIKNVILGYDKGDTIANMRKQLGVKGTQRLNYLDVDPVLQDGSGCGFSAQGSTVFTERDITVKPVKYNDQFCNDTLLGKYTEYKVRFGANANADEFGFESEILGEVGRKIDEKLEKIVWQGDTALTITGLIDLAEGADSASTISANTSSANTVYQNVKAVIMACPEYLLDKLVVFLSPADFRTLCFELTENSNLKIEKQEIEQGEFYFPATSVKVHKTFGLSGVKRIYASPWENLIYATDMMNDSEEYRVWFSDDDDLHKIKVKWVMGVSTLYPDAVIVGDTSK
ncbi:MAG: hypothetical protein IJH39_04020 [Clostridia bacterium]|nr:hypothetical protein [Clostridia bacterium]